MTNLDESEQYIHHAITAYSNKEEIRKLKSEIQKLQEENSKVKHDTSDKKILVKSITGELNQKRTKVMWQAETWKRDSQTVMERWYTSIGTMKN